ncbi:class F sortase [Actinomadura sp. WMMA1423]|uniref:class F sortase n=1 Tax=Actinomadura sp. WMMA1423 TaxID=2591108 RepID=UPI001147352B|nr:class F sortase [Actinomadura sp. WMMA1423]
MPGSSRLLLVLAVAGLIMTGAGGAGLWRAATGDGPADNGHRPSFGSSTATGRRTAGGALGPGTALPAPPVELAAPSAGLHAVVVPVGVDPAGAMALPGDVSRVGWYRYGARPGSHAGSAVLAGHVDSRERGIGALEALRHVSPGDRLTVRLADGRGLRYRAVSRETIGKGSMPLKELFARDGGPRLTVITCGGPFDVRARRYRDNLVITAVPMRP